jgi:hypothetical protein
MEQINSRDIMKQKLESIKESGKEMPSFITVKDTDNAGKVKIYKKIKRDKKK